MGGRGREGEREGGRERWREGGRDGVRGQKKRGRERKGREGEEIEGERDVIITVWVQHIPLFCSIIIIKIMGKSSSSSAQMWKISVRCVAPILLIDGGKRNITLNIE